MNCRTRWGGQRRLPSYFAPAIILLAALAPPASAQQFVIENRGVLLSEGLDAFARDSGWDVVYADRLVQGKVSVCVYSGDRVERALACILQGTGLRSRVVATGQVVIETDPRPTPARGTLAGYVFDRATGEVLPGAHVFLPDRNRGTVSNRAGYFAFPSLSFDPHRLIITFLGFVPRDTVLIITGSPILIGLRSTTLRSEAITVESGGTGRADLGLVPGLIAAPVQRLEQLPASLGGQDLLEALKWMPGVARAGEVTGGLVVRGGGPDQNLYLVDGAPVYHPWHAFSLVSTFQTETFRQIRLYRGAFPAEYGGRLSAVLDTELTDGRRPEPRVVASLGALSGRFIIESPITSTSSFMIAGRRSYLDRIIGRTHPVSDETGRRDTLRTGYYFFDWSAKVVFRPDKDSRISASYYAGGDNLDLRLPFDISLDPSAWLRPADLLFEIDENWTNRLISIRWERLLAEEWFITATAYDARYSAEERAFVQPSLTAAVLSNYGVRLRDLGVSFDVDWYRSLQHQLRAGFRVVNRGFQSSVNALIAYAPGVADGLAQESDQNALETAFYAQDVWRPVGPLHIVLGGRLGFFGQGRYVRFSPRLSAQYAVDPAWLVIQGALSRNHQYVHRIRDRFSFLYDLVSSRWVPSGPDVAPARGTQIAIGLESRPVRGVELRLGLYRRRSQAVLLPTDTFQEKEGLAGPGIELGTLLGQYAPGEERSAGIEFDVTVDRGPWLATFAYTGARAENRLTQIGPAVAGENDWRPTRFDVPHTAEAFVRHRGRHWSFGASATLRSGYPVTRPVAAYELSNPATGEVSRYLHRPVINNSRLPAYFRMDVDASYRFEGLGASWQVRLQLYNALWRRNVVDQVFEPTDSGMSVGNRLGLPLLPLFDIRMEL